MSETNVSIQTECYAMLCTETMLFLNLSLKDLIKYPNELRKESWWLGRELSEEGNGSQYLLKHHLHLRSDVDKIRFP